MYSVKDQTMPDTKLKCAIFKNNELFFFTTCHDKLTDDPNAHDSETALDIRKRKRQIMHALFLRQLIGDKIPVWNRKCSHCGNTNMKIEMVGNESYTRRCPDCDRFVIDTYKCDFALMSNTIYKKYIRENE